MSSQLHGFMHAHRSRHILSTGETNFGLLRKGQLSSYGRASPGLFSAVNDEAPVVLVSRVPYERSEKQRENAGEQRQSHNGARTPNRVQIAGSVPGSRIWKLRAAT